jgi:hypothetical protein
MNCKRCGGFKITDYFYGREPISGFRCINCGDLTGITVLVAQHTQRDEGAERQHAAHMRARHKRRQASRGTPKD